MSDLVVQQQTSEVQVVTHAPDVVVSPNDQGALVVLQEETTLVLQTPALNSPPVLADRIGQVYFSVDGLTMTVETPITTVEGWLVSDTGILLVEG